MKKIIISLCFILCVLFAKSQTQDTSWHNLAACKISPVKANILDATNCDHLAVLIQNDDLKTSADLVIILFDSNQQQHLQATYHISGSTYTAWNHTFAQTYTYVGSHFGFTYQ